MIKYRANCGIETKEYEEDKGKTRNIYLQKKLVEGKPTNDYKDWNMNQQCINCEQIKTKEEEYLNVDDGSTYKCEVKYCVAKKITLEQQYEELKRDKIDLQQAMEGIVNICDETAEGTMSAIIDDVINEIHDIAIQYTRPYKKRE